MKQKFLLVPSTKRRSTLIWLLGALLFFPLANADAYLDGGTGSYLVQILIGAVVGGLYTLKVFGGRIAQFFKRHKPKNTHKNDDK